MCHSSSHVVCYMLNIWRDAQSKIRNGAKKGIKALERDKRQRDFFHIANTWCLFYLSANETNIRYWEKGGGDSHLCFFLKNKATFFLCVFFDIYLSDVSSFHTEKEDKPTIHAIFTAFFFILLSRTLRTTLSSLPHKQCALIVLPIIA